MISGLHYLSQQTSTKSHEQLVVEACEAGIQWIQLRVKNTPTEQWLRIAQASRQICKQYGVTFIVNDNPEIALKSEADGVHLGKLDANPTEARKLLGKNAIIGGTANTEADILRLVNEDVDYIGLGPFRFTTTKENLSPILGLEGYNRIMKWCKEVGIAIPIIAIGGLLPEDVPLLMNTGVWGIAMSSCITHSLPQKEVIHAIQKQIQTFS